MTSGQVPVRRRGRPPRIDRDQIIAAVIAAEDIDRMTMRELAARLGVSHSAVYRWVPDRDALFDLVGSALVDRAVAEPLPVGTLSTRLTTLGHRIRTAFLSVPGFATHLARPHNHSAHALDRLRGTIVDLFIECGVSHPAAQKSWFVFVTTVIAALAAEEQHHDDIQGSSSFDDFLNTLTRGLPLP